MKVTKLTFILALLNAGVAFSQNPWTIQKKNGSEVSALSEAKPANYAAYKLNMQSLKDRLKSAPMERAAASSPFSLSIPMPDNSFEEFEITECLIMAPELAAKYPDIKTYRGYSRSHPHLTLCMDVTPAGFHGMILGGEDQVFIEPGNPSESLYVSFFKSQFPRTNIPSCLFDEEHSFSELKNSIRTLGSSSASAIGSQLRTYRLALATTGEYTVKRGGTKTSALSAMVTSMNRVNGIYEKELDIRMVMIANTDTLIYLNGSTDPYSNNDGATMLGQNQTTIDNIIGNDNYDIGHVFSTGGGGIASRGPCRIGQKARGVTGSPNPVGDPFDVDYVAHEMGHQFGANHTFNSIAGSCNGNRYTTTAYEPGSGSTIMAYAGICTPENLQPNSDPFFHTASFDEIIAYVTTGSGNTCAVVTATGNSAPVISPYSNYSIPYKTPFTLTGAASDPDSDPITYCWEEYDLGPAGSPSAPTGNAPTFRSFPPTTSPSRTFPKLSSILNNTVSVGEVLPTYARSMTFRLTVRDNKTGGGGVTHTTTPLTLTVINTGSPFQVLSPNTATVTWVEGTQEDVTWDVASTDFSPINCTTVNILLSTDGGLTFPITLAGNTPNDGTEKITVPANLTTKARIKVEAAQNVFFDISDKNFTITNVSDIQARSAFSSLNFYPNPAEHSVRISLSNSYRGRVNISVIDGLGRIVKTSVSEKQNDLFEEDQDIRDLSYGVYTVRISLGAEEITKRLVRIKGE
jgi:hypothetical protein